MSILPSSAGIYKILCTANHKVYIGSTTEIRKRWGWHRSDLRRDVHHNRHMQFAWNKYGEQSFEFEILEMVMFAEYLHDREQHWLDYYQAYESDKGFNHGKIARAPWLGRKHSEETKQRLSALAKQQMSADQMVVLREQAAAWHGSADGLHWHSGQAKRFWAAHQPITRQCDLCGNAYQTNASHGMSKFCSANCKNRSRYAQRLDHETRQCTVCGTSFSCKKYYPTRCCSGSCAAKLRHRGVDGAFS